MSDGFEAILATSSPRVRDLAEGSRALIREVLPGVVEVPWPTQRVIGYGVGPKKMSEHFCYIAVHRDHVNLGFNAWCELRRERRRPSNGASASNDRGGSRRQAEGAKRPADGAHPTNPSDGVRRRFSVHPKAPTTHTKRFNYGAELPDPERLLAGPGKLLRHTKIAGPDDLARPALRQLLVVASTHRMPVRATPVR